MIRWINDNALFLLPLSLMLPIIGTIISGLAFGTPDGGGVGAILMIFGMLTIVIAGMLDNR